MFLFYSTTWLKAIWKNKEKYLFTRFEVIINLVKTWTKNCERMVTIGDEADLDATDLAAGVLTINGWGKDFTDISKVNDSKLSIKYHSNL